MNQYSGIQKMFWKILWPVFVATGLTACGGTGSSTSVTLPAMNPTGTQTLTLSGPANLQSGQTHQLSMTNSAGASGGAISFTATPATACTVSASGLVTAGTAGQICQVSASSAGTAIYKAGGPVSVAIAITASSATSAKQTLTVSAPSAGASLLPNQTQQISVINSAGSAGGALSYVSTFPAACTVSNTGLITAGQTSGQTCIVTVSAAATGIYAASSAVVAVAISAPPAPTGTQTLTISSPAVNALVPPGSSVQMVVSNSAGSAGGALSYSTTTPTACSVSSAGLITAGQTAGQPCIVQVSAAANNAYLAGAAMVSVTIASTPTPLGTQTLSISSPTANSSLTAGSTVQMSVSNSAGSAGGALSYTTSTPAACSVSNTGFITAGQSGGQSCTVTVSAAANSAYQVGTAMVTITIAALPIPLETQTLTIISPAANASLSTGSTVQMSVNNSAGLAGGALAYTATPASACSVSATGLVTAVTAGQNCTVSVIASANTNYQVSAPASVVLSMVAPAGPQNISITAPTGSIAVGATQQIVVAGAAPGAVITYGLTASSWPGCSVSATGLVTGLASGQPCNITAQAAAIGNYTASASVSATPKIVQTTGTSTACPASFSGGVPDAAISLSSTNAALCNTNVLALYMDNAYNINNRGSNIIYATVQICAPGKTVNSSADCAVIDHVIVDTGSVGLRIFESAIKAANPNLMNALPKVNNPGQAGVLGNCAMFGSAVTWGGVRRIDLHVGGVNFQGETARDLNIQVIGDSSPEVGTSAAADACLQSYKAVGGGANALSTTPSAISGNGILGIGSFRADVAVPSSAGGYYNCTTASCVLGSFDPTTNNWLTSSVQHPITRFGVDSNGSSIVMPAMPANGYANLATGMLIFGFQTQDNNGIAPSSLFTAAPLMSQYFNATFAGFSGPTFFDSGAAGLFIGGTSGLTACVSGLNYLCSTNGNTAFSLTTDGGTVNVNMVGTVSFNSYPVNNSGALPSAANGVAVSMPGGNILGAPFFFGRTIATLIAGMNIGATTGAAALNRQAAYYFTP